MCTPSNLSRVTQQAAGSGLLNPNQGAGCQGGPPGAWAWACTWPGPRCGGGGSAASPPPLPSWVQPCPDPHPLRAPVGAQDPATQHRVLRSPFPGKTAGSPASPGDADPARALSLRPPVSGSRQVREARWWGEPSLLGSAGRSLCIKISSWCPVLGQFEVTWKQQMLCDLMPRLPPGKPRAGARPRPAGGLRVDSQGVQSGSQDAVPPGDRPGPRGQVGRHGVTVSRQWCYPAGSRGMEARPPLWLLRGDGAALGLGAMPPGRRGQEAVSAGPARPPPPRSRRRFRRFGGFGSSGLWEP